MKKRALLVGVDYYPNSSNLNGCASDATRLAERLRSNSDTGSKNFDCKVLTGPHGSPVGRDELKAMAEQCFAPGADVVLFFFAGHGADSGGEDVVLCTSDGTGYTPGVEFSYIMKLIRESNASEKIVILDCCFAGGAGGLEILGTGEAAFLPPGTTILAASRGDQVSMEDEDGGLFTTALCMALDGGAADVLGAVTTAGVYGYVDQSFGAWAQRPTFRANVDELHVLRTTPPGISRSDLNRLALEIFPDVRAEYPLDSSYEPDADPHVPEHEELFGVLQRARANKLVEPVGEEHLYYAAMNEKSCVLTPLGQFHCRLIQEEAM